MGFYHPRRLPHGECGVWGSAPGDESSDTFNSAHVGHIYDKVPTNSADEPKKRAAPALERSVML